jgi:hypothetical protein
MHLWKSRRVTPAFVVAMIALFVALGGTAGAVAVQAVPLAKRALTADNAKKLGGQTSAQITSKAARAPGPASTANGLVTVKTAPFAIPAGQQGEFTATCDAGQKAIGGGYDNPAGTAFSFDTRPTSNGSAWSVYLVAGDSSAAIGNIFAVCLR